MKKNKLNKSWFTNPRGQDDTYKKEKKLRKEGEGGGFGDSGVLYLPHPTQEYLPQLMEIRRENQKRRRKVVLEDLPISSQIIHPNEKWQNQKVVSFL